MASVDNADKLVEGLDKVIETDEQSEQNSSSEDIEWPDDENCCASEFKVDDDDDTADDIFAQLRKAESSVQLVASQQSTVYSSQLHLLNPLWRSENTSSSNLSTPHTPSSSTQREKSTVS